MREASGASADLTPTQRAVLGAAAQHPEHRVEVFPDGLKGGARAKVLAALHARKLLNKHGANYSINKRGLVAIGADVRAEQQTPAPDAAERKAAKKSTAQGTLRTESKGSKVLALLQRPAGATLPQLMDATGWQAHSVRGFISGTLAKKHGHTVESAKNDRGERCYRITSATAASS